MTDIQYLIDRQEIVDVLHRLGRWLDGRGGDPTTIYTPDVIVQSPRGQTRGIERVIEVAGPDIDSDERVTHQHTDIAVSIEGDTAHATAHEVTRFFPYGETPWRTSGLWVEYRLTRVTESWRIAAAQIQLEWLDGRPLG